MYLILNVEMDSGCIELIGKTNIRSTDKIRTMINQLGGN